MPWPVSIDGTLTHSGTTPETFMLSATAGQGTVFYLDLIDYQDYVGLVFMASEDGRNGWMAGVFNDAGANGANLSLRAIVDGVIQAPVTGGDAPDVATPVAHTLSANVPFTLRVEIANGRIKVSLLSPFIAGIVALSYLNDTAPTFFGNVRVGVWSQTDVARAIRLRTQPILYQTSAESQVLYWAQAGDVWAVYDGLTPERVGRSVLPASGPLRTSVFGGLAYFAGEGFIGVFDPQARTLTPYEPTAGSLPGQSGGGFFDVFGVYRSHVRLGFAMRAGVIISAVGEATNVDTGAIESGAAYDLAVSAGRNFGEDLVAAFEAGDNTIIHATTNAVFATVGDPVNGGLRQYALTMDSGMSGWNAAAPLDATGTTLIHSRDGVLVVNATSGGVNISNGVLRAGLSTGRDSASKIVSCLRDTQRGYVCIFLTNERVGADLGEPATHYFYDEQMGGFAAGSAAWFPVAFGSAGLDPSCGTMWRGGLVLGCMDGQVRMFSDASDVDKLDRVATVAVTAFLEAATVDAPMVTAGAMINYVQPELTTDSGPVTMTIYGADSVERLFDPAARRALWSGSFVDGQVKLARVRANALSVRIAGSGAARWFVTQVESDIDAVESSRRFGSPKAITPPCRPTWDARNVDPVTPPDPWTQCGNETNTDTPPVPGGSISVAMGSTTTTGQNVTPSFDPSPGTDLTGATYDWSVDGFASVYASGDNQNPAPQVELSFGWRTIRVTVSGGTLRAPLLAYQAVFVSKNATDIGGDPGGTTDIDGITGVDRVRQLTPGQFYNEMPASSECAIYASGAPAPPAGAGGGIYASGGFL